MNFMEAMGEELVRGKNNVSVTENGAVGYRTTGKALLDLNYAVSSLRNAPEEKIMTMFSNACVENPDLAMLWLFMARDPRGGMGERRLFRVCFAYLMRNFPEKAEKLVPLIPEFGRWDDVIDMYFACNDEQLKKSIFAVIFDQLNDDTSNMIANKPISCLAKWLPSENTSSMKSRNQARAIIKTIHTNPRQYRKLLSALRGYIDVVERKMSAGNWDKIRYSAVPSRANLIYKDAFLKHDRERREEFLESLKSGETKINASTLYPHEIVAKYTNDYRTRLKLDDTLEGLWNHLPDAFKDNPEIMVVADGSGSMTWARLGEHTTPLHVANALAIYFAERLAPPYKNQYITFSSSPQFVRFPDGATLRDRIAIALEHCECSNTNLKKVFDLVLATAKMNHAKQEDLPKTILVISDGEFDEMNDRALNEKSFDVIRREYNNAGYQIPKLAFWNVASRTMTIPVIENPMGVSLISGYSPTVIRMVLSGKLDPYEAMVSMLMEDRYRPVREALEC
jgi:hypothetical protein